MEGKGWQKIYQKNMYREGDTISAQNNWGTNWWWVGTGIQIKEGGVSGQNIYLETTGWKFLKEKKEYMYMYTCLGKGVWKSLGGNCFERCWGPLAYEWH